MRTYELLIILPPESDEQVVSGVVDRVSQPLTASGGKVERIDRWGRRRLAYEIARHQEGYYLLLDISAEPSSLKEIDRILSLADEVLRFKAVVKPVKPGKPGKPKAAQAARSFPLCPGTPSPGRSGRTRGW